MLIGDTIQVVVPHSLGVDEAMKRLERLKEGPPNPNVVISNINIAPQSGVVALDLEVYKVSVHARIVVAPKYVSVDSDPITLPWYTKLFTIPYANSVVRNMIMVVLK